jgi:RNA polymerase sigma-70 factor (ECF subfamily)
LAQRLSAGRRTHADIPLASLTPGALIDRCIRQDEDAWDEFIRRYGRLVYGTVVRKLFAVGCADAKSDADDIFQEVFEDLLDDGCRALTVIRDRNRIEPWLCAIAIHKTVDFVRAKERIKRTTAAHSYLVGQDAAYHPSSAGETELAHEVGKAVNQLSPHEQLLVKWYYVHGLKYREIARLSNTPINTVSSRLFRIRKKLLRRMKKASKV